MKPPIVWRDGLRLLNVSYKPPTRFFQVLFTLWSCTMQSGEFTGKPPRSSASSPVNSAMRVRSLTLPAPGHTLIPNFACKGFTMGLVVVVNYYNLNSSILKNFIKFFGYAKSHGSDYCCGWWSCHLQEQWICKKGGLIFMRFSTKF